MDNRSRTLLVSEIMKELSGKRNTKRIILQIPFLLGVLIGLFVASFHVPTFQISWVIHFLFVFTLTILIYRNLLNTTHLRLYLVGLVSLMVLWEVYEWLEGDKIEGSTLLTGLDTSFDLVLGFLGALVAIRRT